MTKRDVRQLTIAQTELLYEVTEMHQKWYEEFYSEVPSFDILLELNHNKIMFLIDDNTSESFITETLKEMYSRYKELSEQKDLSDDGYYE